MDRKQRVIWSDNGSLKDISASVNNYIGGGFSLPIVASEDKIYIGTEYPFNNKYFLVDSTNKNIIASTISVEIWDGSGWQATVDLKDETASAASACFNQSGMLSFCRDIDKSGWNCEQDSKNIAALSTLRIFNLYWCRLTFSADLTPATKINYIGQRFNSDAELFAQYPVLNNSDLIAAYETGKTDWNNQCLAAAEYITRDLRRQNIIVRREQIFDCTLYKDAGIHKTAAIIFSGLGNGYRDAMNDANAAYTKCLNINFHEVDRDGSGIVEAEETRFSVTYGTR